MWFYILPLLGLLLNCQHSIASPATKHPSSSVDPFSTALNSFNSFWTSVIPKKPNSSTRPISNLRNFANIFSPSVPSKQTVPRSSAPPSPSIMDLPKYFWSSVILNEPIVSSPAPPFSNALNTFGTFLSSLVPKKPLSSYPPISTALSLEKMFLPLKVFVPSKKQTIPPSSTPPASTVLDSLKTVLNPVTKEQHILNATSEIPSILEEKEMVQKEQSDLDLHTTNQPSPTTADIETPAPSPTSTNEKPSIHENEPLPSSVSAGDVTLTPTLRSTLSDSDLENLMNTTISVFGPELSDELNTNQSTSTSDIETSAPTLSTFDHPQDMKDDTDDKEGSGSTLSVSDSDILSNTTNTELSESSILEEKEKSEEEKHKNEEEQEKTEEHEEKEEVQEEHSSTTPIPTTSTTPDNDPIYDVSNVCGPNSQCYVSPKDCSSRCEVIYSVEPGHSKLYVRQLFLGNIITLKTSSYVKNHYDTFSCFETAAYCLYGWDGQYDFRRGMVDPVGWDMMDNNKHVWTFNRAQPPVQVGEGDQLQFRIDPERDVVGGPFQELFLKSNE